MSSAANGNSPQRVSKRSTCRPAHPLVTIACFQRLPSPINCCLTGSHCPLQIKENMLDKISASAPRLTLRSPSTTTPINSGCIRAAGECARRGGFNDGTAARKQIKRSHRNQHWPRRKDVDPRSDFLQTLDKFVLRVESALATREKGDHTCQKKVKALATLLSFHGTRLSVELHDANKRAEKAEMAYDALLAGECYSCQLTCHMSPLTTSIGAVAITTIPTATHVHK